MRCPPQFTLRNLLLKLHEDKALESMSEVQSKAIKTYRSTDIYNRQVDPKKREIKYQVLVYTKEKTVRDEFVANKAMSLVMSEDARYYALYYRKTARTEVKLGVARSKEETRSITRDTGCATGHGD